MANVKQRHLIKLNICFEVSVDVRVRFLSVDSNALFIFLSVYTPFIYIIGLLVGTFKFTHWRILAPTAGRYRDIFNTFYTPLVTR